MTSDIQEIPSFEGSSITAGRIQAREADPNYIDGDEAPVDATGKGAPIRERWTPVNPSKSPACPDASLELGPVVVHLKLREPMRFHPYAQLFPVSYDEAFWELVEDVRLNGVRNPIIMFKGQLLDGRHRYVAARECHQPYPAREFLGTDPLGYVISLNLKRRHLAVAQRAIVATKIANLKSGRPSKTLSIDGVSLAEAARVMGVSAASVARASAVQAHGVPELVAKVEAAELTLGAASTIARLSRDMQIRILAEGPEAVREVATTLRHAAFTAGHSDGAANQPALIAEDADQFIRLGRSAVRPIAGSRGEWSLETSRLRVVAACNAISREIGKWSPQARQAPSAEAPINQRDQTAFQAAHAALGECILSGSKIAKTSV